MMDSDIASALLGGNMRTLVFGILCISASLARADSGTSIEIPKNLLPPPGFHRISELHGDGVQRYRCGSASGEAAVWIFESPRADLTDMDGKNVGRHYAGPTWEAGDGSKITGKVIEKAAAPDATAIAWLLLKTESAGIPGRFDAVRAVQRIATSGGMAPPGPCSTPGEMLEVPYRAVYVFWGP